METTKKKRKLKSKPQRIQEAMKALTSALAMEEADVRIEMHFGYDYESPEGKELTAAIKALMKAYKKVYGKAKLELVL
jgi:di/tripeptidase